VVLLENLRRNKGEMSNGIAFAKKLASYADIYVNDAFSVSHRPHASIVGIPKQLPSYAGLEFEEEIAHLGSIFKPAHPFFVILSGAKFSTKLPLLTKFLTLADHVFVGGALLNDLLLSVGYEVGTSLVENNKKTQSELKKLFTHPKLILPEDLLVKRSGSIKNVSTNEVDSADQIVDVGMRTTLTLCEIGKQSKLVLWNGPLGIYEDGYDKGTRVLLNTLASSKGDTIIGGGDTGALVTKSGLEKKFHFVSIGGGATLEFLAHGTLVGIKALEFKNKIKK
jgi:phosphoglycerate kinase